MYHGSPQNPYPATAGVTLSPQAQALLANPEAGIARQLFGGPAGSLNLNPLFGNINSVPQGIIPMAGRAFAV